MSTARLASSTAHGTRTRATSLTMSTVRTPQVTRYPSIVATAAPRGPTATVSATHSPMLAAAPIRVVSETSLVRRAAA